MCAVSVIFFGIQFSLIAPVELLPVITGRNDFFLKKLLLRLM
jgi:hypothetical protein